MRSKDLRYDWKVGLSTSMSIIGSLYASDSVHPNADVGRWVVLVLIVVFALFYSATWGIIGEIHASEVQTVEIRAAAQGLYFVSPLTDIKNIRGGVVGKIAAHHSLILMLH